MTTTTPHRTPEQQFDALARANVIRSRRAQLKRDMKAGRDTAVRYILDPPEWAETMKVWDLLLAIRGQGRVKVAKHLKRVAVSPSKTLGGLSTRQRRELVEWLR